MRGKGKRIGALLLVMAMVLTGLVGCSKDKNKVPEVTPTPAPQSEEQTDGDTTQDDMKKYMSECQYVSVDDLLADGDGYKGKQLDLSFYVTGLFEPDNLEVKKDNQYYVGYMLEENSDTYDVANQWFILNTADCDNKDNLKGELVRAYGEYAGFNDVEYTADKEQQVYISKDGERIEVDENGMIVEVTEERTQKAVDTLNKAIENIDTTSSLKSITLKIQEMIKNEKATADDTDKLISSVTTIYKDSKTTASDKSKAKELIKLLKEIKTCQQGNTKNISDMKDVTAMTETNRVSVKASIPVFNIKYITILEGSVVAVDTTVKVSKDDLISEKFPWMNKDDASTSPTPDVEDGNVDAEDGDTKDNEDVNVPTVETAPTPEIVDSTSATNGGSKGNTTSTNKDDGNETVTGGSTKNDLTAKGDNTDAITTKSGKATVYYKNKNREVSVLIGGYEMKGVNKRTGLVRGSAAVKLLDYFGYDYADDIASGNELAILHFTVKIKDTDAGYGSDCIPDIRVRSSKGTMIDNSATPYYVVELDKNDDDYGNYGSYTKEYDLVFQVPEGVNAFQVWFGRAQGTVYKWAYTGGTVNGLVK